MRISVERRVVGIAVLGLVAVTAGVGLLVGVDGGASPSDQSVTSAALETVNRFAGGPPERCVYSGPGREVCSWRIEGRLFGSDQRSPAGTSREVVLVCEISRDPAVEQPACRAHAAEHEETTAAGHPALPSVGAAGPADSGQQLATALTVAELSHLAGDVPDRCRTGPGLLNCRWDLSRGSVGHRRLAVGAGTQGPVSLRCALPLDGSSRASNSCTLEASQETRP